MHCMALLGLTSPYNSNNRYLQYDKIQNGIGAPGRFKVQQVSATSQILKNGHFFALLKTSSGECKASGRPWVYISPKRMASFSFLDKLALDGPDLSNGYSNLLYYRQAWSR